MMKNDLTLHSYFDLLEACAKPGCPLCQLSEKWVNSYLDEFVRKNDYRLNKDGFGAEGDGWRRALAWMVGAKDGR